MPIKRVLIVDDALDFGRMLQAALAMLNAGRMQVALVPSAEEALLEITRHKPDLVVSDLRLPGISGFDLLRKIRARSGAIKLVVVTGLKDPGLAEQATQAGADLFFVKPLAVSAFVEAVGRLLGADEDTPPPAQTTSAAVAGGTAPTLAPLAGELLATTRAGLGALAVLLLGSGGEVLASAGEAPDPALEARLLPAARAILAAVVGLAYPADPVRQELVMAVKGREADWVFCPTGAHMLLIALPAGGGAVRLPLAVEAALALRADLVAVLSTGLVEIVTAQPAIPEPSVPGIVEMVTPEEPPVEAAPEPLQTEEADLADLDDLFSHTGAALPAGGAQDFWERAAATGARRPVTGKLNYEQALGLGLTPTE